MREIALHILDIVQNSLTAKANRVKMDFSLDKKSKMLSIKIKDNGVGMDSETLQQITDPFVTSRTKRKVGMGLSLLKFHSELTGGSFDIFSEVGKGTMVDVCFDTGNIDCEPLGSVEDTFIALVGSNPEVDFVLTLESGEHSFSLETEEIKRQLEGVSIAELDVLMYLKEQIKENKNQIFGEEI